MPSYQSFLCFTFEKTEQVIRSSNQARPAELSSYLHKQKEAPHKK